MQHTSHTIESVWTILGSCTKNLSECMELLLELWFRYNNFLRFNTPREDSLESQYFLTKNRCTILPQTSPRCLFNYSAKGGAYIGRRVFINQLFTCTDSPMVEAQKLIYHIYQVEIETGFPWTQFFKERGGGRRRRRGTVWFNGPGGWANIWGRVILGGNIVTCMEISCLYISLQSRYYKES